MATMKYDQRQRARGRRSRQRVLSPIAAVLAIAFVSLLLSGCGGLLSSKRAASDHESLANGSPSISKTTTTTISLHERIQQEQAEVALGVATTTSAADAISETSSTADTSTTSTTSAPVYVLSDGSTMSPGEFEAIQSYVDEVAPLAQQQYELATALNPDSHFDFLDVTSQGIENYRQAFAQQQILCNDLAAMAVPAFMAESHRLRALAADQLYDVASTIIGQLEQGGFYPADSDLLEQARSQFEVGMATLADAEFGLQIWQQLIQGAFLQ
jgi:hypothetical protein